MPVLFRRAYTEPGVEQELTELLAGILAEGQAVFLCVGTDKNILDCLGPLTGTMLQEAADYIPVYGTLDAPIHARNLRPKLREIRSVHPGDLMLAIDACLGTSDEFGTIKLRRGSLVPGRALNRPLPAVGDIALTGTVATYQGKKGYYHLTRGSITPVYHIARIFSRAIVNAYPGD